MVNSINYGHDHDKHHENRHEPNDVDENLLEELNLNTIWAKNKESTDSSQTCQKHAGNQATNVCSTLVKVISVRQSKLECGNNDQNVSSQIQVIEWFFEILQFIMANLSKFVKNKENREYCIDTEHCIGSWEYNNSEG